MGWFKDTWTSEPIECPRGWGSVTFVLKFFILPPIFSIDRTCPIGGVTDCSKCRYPVNPESAERLRGRLEELDSLRGGTLSEAEFRIRRRLIVEAHEPRQGVPGESAAAAAFVLGPLGLVATVSGAVLSLAVHAGFLGLLGGGLVLGALAAGFAGLSRMQRGTLPKPDEVHFDALPEDTQELEAQLGRAQEELTFFRDLHRAASPDQLSSPDADDPPEE
jgi:hypothetical protein